MIKKLTSTEFNSSFLSCENDIEIILNKLFVSSSYSDDLKKLLVINTKDCLDNTDSQVIKDTIAETSLATLIKQDYIRLVPKLEMDEHEEVKSYIIISIDDFAPNDTNPQFRDCTVNFDIVCHMDSWYLGNYRIRPIKIAGYIDGILNNAKLTGIGTFNFLGCKELILNEELAGYSLSYRAVHGSDDKISFSE